jgi:energy-coupling factor transporter ATP-binding protein EcfA2
MRLSGGERQRISLARAFLKDAPILILDEPTSSVDMVTEAAIMEAMQRLMDGRTSFMIAHRVSTLENCDMLLVIEHGRLSAETSKTLSGTQQADLPAECPPEPVDFAAWLAGTANPLQVPMPGKAANPEIISAVVHEPEGSKAQDLKPAAPSETSVPAVRARVSSVAVGKTQIAAFATVPVSSDSAAPGKTFKVSSASAYVNPGPKATPVRVAQVMIDVIKPPGVNWKFMALFALWWLLGFGLCALVLQGSNLLTGPSGANIPPMASSTAKSLSMATGTQLYLTEISVIPATTPTATTDITAHTPIPGLRSRERTVRNSLSAATRPHSALHIPHT